MNTKSILTTITFCATTAIASAAGYQVLEQGASNMGTSTAGATVNANLDATTAFWNPSAATFMDLKVGETRLDAALFAVIPTLVCDIDTAPGVGSKWDGDCSANSYIPQMFAVHRFTDDLYGTLSITAPWGLESDYDPNWVANSIAMRSYLLTVDINPSLTYKVNDWLSISGGVSLQYAYCKLTQMMSDYVFGGSPYSAGKFSISGDGYAVGGNIGFTAKYAEGGRFGFQWRSAVEHTLKGNAKYQGNIVAPVSADMHMPHTFTMGIYQRLWGALREFAVMADYSYIMWSMFDKLEVNGLHFPIKVDEYWEDTSRVSLGFHYYPEEIENLTVRFGVCYDESGVQDQYRTARIPCGDRVWFSGGLGYIWENISFDLSYTYIMVVGNNPINEAGWAGSLTGDYNAHIHVIGAQVGYKF